MASSGIIGEHHNSLTYAETEADPPADARFMVTWAADGRAATVSGPCPACGGRTATEFSAGIGGRSGFRNSPSRPQGLPSPVTLFCECGHAHADRPPEALDKGCGRFWLVVLPDDARQPPSGGAASAPDAPDVPAAP